MKEKITTKTTNTYGGEIGIPGIAKVSIEKKVETVTPGNNMIFKKVSS